MADHLTPAQEYVRRRTKRSPPRYLQHKDAPDWATIMYWQVAKYLPKPMQEAQGRGLIAVAETGDSAPDMRVVNVAPGNYAVLVSGGVLDMILSIALALWGYDPRTLRRVPEPIAIDGVVERLGDVVRHWARRMKSQVVWPRRYRVGRRISELPDEDLDWFHGIVDSMGLFMFAHEMAHIELDMKLVEPIFPKEETNADWYGCELYLQAAAQKLHPRMMYSGPLLAMRLFGALQQLGVKFSDDYDPPDARGQLLRRQLRAKCPSQQYFNEIGTVIVANLDYIDDMMDRIAPGSTPWQPDPDRVAARLIAQLIAVAQEQVSLKTFAEDIATLAAHTDADVMNRAARTVWSYYLPAGNGSASYLPEHLRVVMGAKLCELMDHLPPALRNLFVDAPVARQTERDRTVLHPVINLDAYMRSSAVLARLARYGLWTQPPGDAARAWIDENAAAAGIPADEMAKRLERDPKGFRVAIRRQWHTNILWYSRSALEVLVRCGSAHGNTLLLDALGLHEPDSRPPVQVDGGRIEAGAEGVVLSGSTPVAVSETPAVPRMTPKPEERAFAQAGYRGIQAMAPAPGGAIFDGMLDVAAAAPPQSISAFPRIDAPDYVPAEEKFLVRIGLAKERMAGVAGGPIVVPVPAGAKHVDVDVELVADGLVAEQGWTRTLSVDVDDPTAASVEFVLRGNPPDNPDKIHLTTLEIRYVYKGVVCGFATRPLVVGPAGVAASPALLPFGMPWQKQHILNSPIDVAADPEAPDLTIEILKPDKDATNGRYVCMLYSPHALKTARGPFPMQLGDDAKTFAKETVEKVRIMSGRKTLDDMVRARARLIAGRLPAEAFDALREVAAKVSPQPPAVLVVSAEQFVPWELAEVDPPLDAARPGVLGAQAIVGRWLRDEGTRPSPKPPLKPLSAMDVPSIAVMIGEYAGANGFNALPFAEKEAGEMKRIYGAVIVKADDDGLHQLICADVPPIGSPGAIHFAGHGEYDPSRVDSSVMVLSDGMEMDSMLFGGAKYGDKTQPLIFMNACMIGVGGEVLGASGGFPGNCLRGGFGAFVGALWEVNDKIAHDVALEFWKRALPVDGGVGETIGGILRDVRTRYSASGNALPVSTYLAYVYYGHPRLKLRKAA